MYRMNPTLRLAALLLLAIAFTTARHRAYGQAGAAADGSHTGHGGHADASAERASDRHPAVDAYDAQLVAALAAEAEQLGDAVRGAAVFASARSACLSCHRVGSRGGSVGPELTEIGSRRDLRHLVESVFWPRREIEPQYTLWRVLTVDGELLSGYKEETPPGSPLRLRDGASGEVREIPLEDIEDASNGGSLMPQGLAGAMSRQQQLDLFCFLCSLGRGDVDGGVIEMALAHAQMAHGPAEFSYDRQPLVPDRWPNRHHPINRDRVYDFYTKQAEYFRQQPQRPMLLAEFPGLDGGQFGHWGNQNEDTWASDRWNDTGLGSVQCGVFHADGATVARAVVVRLGENGEISACFNPDTLTYDALWTGGFVRFSSVRHGFMHGLQRVGRPLPHSPGAAPDEPFEYHGFYRHGERVVFAYRIGDTEYLDAPWVEEGRFVRHVAPAENHPMRQLTTGGPRQWPQTLRTAITPGTGRPYAVDTIELPHDNPWNALMFCGGHDFLPDGSALVCTMQGDVWRVDGLSESVEEQGTARWRRFASGLHHALGLVVHGNEIYVQCRDQITRLHDTNGDGEADFYECFSNAFETSPAGHDFICGLERDEAGNFYTASGNQGVLRISPDGQRAEVIATGFRNPDGLGLLPDGTVTVPASEGEWTPASMICAIAPRSESGAGGPTPAPPHFGYRGPIDQQPPELPLVYLPRGLDNSSGGQTYVTSDAWGPLKDQLLHFSFGAGTHFLVLRDEVDGQLQGAVVPLAGDFSSGVHRGRFSPRDGQLYVSGMNGWGSYATQDGCFQRVRYTGDSVQLPVGFHVHENGVAVTFAEPIDRKVAEMSESHFAQCWNYRYSAAYGSAEYSPSHPGAPGHDPLTVASAHVSPDGRTLFLELPDLQPVSQLHLRLHVDEDEGHDLFATVHRLDRPFEDFPGYRPVSKTIAAHPLLSDLAMQTQQVPNPWRDPIEGARRIEIATAENLTYATRTLHVRRGEAIELTLRNPDVVPHNWALIRPGSLAAVGELANRLISDPEAVARHYIPESDNVLVYTDVVPPGEAFTVYFHAPDQPGRYPYLCTFPGHWMVMNGVMVVESE